MSDKKDYKTPAAAAATAAISVSFLAPVVGAKRTSEDSNASPNKKTVNYGYCCTNEYTGRCEPITSEASQAIEPQNRAAKCAINQQTCEARCRPENPIPAELQNLIFDYAPFVVQTGLDIKQDDPVFMNNQNNQKRIFGSFNASGVALQRQQSERLDALLDEWKEETFVMRAQDDIGRLPSLLKQITDTVSQPKFAVNIEQTKKLIYIYRDTYSMEDFVVLYERILERLPKDAEFVYFMFLQLVRGDYREHHAFFQIVSSMFQKLFELPVSSYAKVLQLHKDELKMSFKPAMEYQAEYGLSRLTKEMFTQKHHFRIDNLINQLNKWHGRTGTILWLSGVLRNFPKNFAVALFQFAITTSAAPITVWHWKELISALLTRDYNPLSWKEGTYLLNQLQSLYNDDGKRVGRQFRKWSSTFEIDQKVAKDIMDKNDDRYRLPEHLIKMYSLTLQYAAWYQYNKEINGIENAWLKIVINYETEPETKLMIQRRIDELEEIAKKQPARTAGSFRLGCSFSKPHLLLSLF